MRHEELYLRDMVKAADHVSNMIHGHDLDSFSSTVLVYSATLYQLITIGEAAARLSDDFRKRYPEVPWSDIIGFRHVAVHSYFATDLKVAWDAATQDVPFLRDRINRILQAEFGDQGA